MLIPYEVYALVESKLKKRHLLIARAEIRLMQAQADAEGMLLPSGGQAAPGGKRRHRKSRAEQAERPAGEEAKRSDDGSEEPCQALRRL